MSRGRLRVGILTAGLALLCGVVAGVPPADAETFALTGTVTDDSSSPVVNVIVDVLDSPTGNAVTTTTTDGSGHYAISITEGTYDVRFTPPAGSGLEQTTIRGEDVQADTVLDVTLPATPLGATVVAPKSGQTISGTYALAALTTGTVDRVEFYVDDVLIGQATVGLGWNYRWPTGTVTEGGHWIQAKAYSGSQSVLSPVVLFNVRRFLPGQIIDWDQITNFPEGGWLRMTKLNNGTTWLAASVHSGGLRRSEIGIYRSTNKARTWTKIANVDDGDRLVDNPNLLQLPNGEVLLATRNWVTAVSYRISLWRSSDKGVHWTGPVKVAGNETPAGNQYLNVAEPWLFMLEDGRVSIVYSDGTEAGIGFRQKITQKTSPDGGRTWPGPKTFAAALQDDRSRPGMPVVLRMTNGQYLLLFEAGGTDNFYVHYKRSNDGVTWTSDLGTRISTNQQCGPGAVALADGRVVVTSCTRAVSYSNDFGVTWKSNDPAFTDGYWSALYEIEPGVIAYANSGPPRLRFGLVKPR